MDRFRQLSAFIAVADAQAFNAAARALGLSPSSVTRLINALESRIGARLFSRTTRRLSLTEAGERLYMEAERILGLLDTAEALAAGAHRKPAGVLRVTAPILFGQMYVAPILRDYLDRYPGVSAFLILLDRIANLIDEGIDVALRIGELPDSSLAALRIGELRNVIVAAPSYLAGHSAVSSPKDLAGHRIIAMSDRPGPQDWSFHQNGRLLSVRVQPRLSVNTLTAAIDAARAGWGITRALSYQVADDLAEGRLIEILPHADSRRLPVHLVHVEGGRAAAKTRAFIDLAAETLREQSRRLAAV